MKEVIAAIIAGCATVLAAWITSQKKRKPNGVGQSKSVDALARYIALFAAGTVTAFALLVALREQGPGLGDRVPVGTIVAYMGNAEPPGWLLCDGRDISGDPKYRELMNVVGRRLPSTQGRFLRGADPTGTLDPDGKTRALGTPQDDTLKSHTHGYSYWRHNDDAGGKSGGGSPDVAGSAATGTTDPNRDGGTETRPKNVSVNFLIKY